MTFNPFTYSGALKEPRRFIGRREQMAEIFQAIHGTASVSVVGERQIGKSSLLRYIADPTVEHKCSLEPDRHVFVYFDFQGLSSITPFQFWRLLLGQAMPILSDETLNSDVLRVATQESIELSDVFGLLQSFERRQKRLVFLLDTFDSAAQNPHFDVNFFRGLRNLVNNFSLSFILASRYMLQELRYAHKNILTSSFFNAFRPICLPAFTPQEVNDLLDAALVDSEIQFTHADRVFIDHVAGPHPCFVQMAAHHVFEAYDSGCTLPDGQPDTRWIVARLRDYGAGHLRHCWDNSENGEKIILVSLALAGRGRALQFDLPAHFARHPTYAQAWQSLERRALVTADERSQWHTFSLLLDSWLTDTFAFIPNDRADDLAALIEQTRLKDLRQDWMDRTERLRRGYAWIDGQAIFRTLLAEKEPQVALDLLSQIVLYYLPH